MPFAKIFKQNFWHFGPSPASTVYLQNFFNKSVKNSNSRKFRPAKYKHYTVCPCWHLSYPSSVGTFQSSALFCGLGALFERSLTLITCNFTEKLKSQTDKQTDRQTNLELSLDLLLVPVAVVFLLAIVLLHRIAELPWQCCVLRKGIRGRTSEERKGRVGERRGRKRRRRNFHLLTDLGFLDPIICWIAIWTSLSLVQIWLHLWGGGGRRGRRGGGEGGGGG